MPLQLSNVIRSDLGRTRGHGTRQLQKYNELLVEGTLPWNEDSKEKFQSLKNQMKNTLNSFETCYNKWEALIQGLDDKDKAKAEEQLLIEWKEKPEFDDLIYDLNDAVVQIEVSMKRKINGNFQGEVPTNNIPPFTEEQAVIIGKLGCVEANKEKIQVSDAKASKQSLVETTDHIMDIQSESSTTQIVSIEPASPRAFRQKNKGTKTIEKSKASLTVQKTDCKKVASVQTIVENEARQASTTAAEFQRQNKYDRPPSQKFSQQRPIIDEQTSGKLVQPKFMKQLDPLSSRAVYEHPNVAHKNYPIRLKPKLGPFVSKDIFEHSSLVPEKFPSSGRLEKVEPKIVNQIDTLGPRAVFDLSTVADQDFQTTLGGREGPPAYGKNLVEQFDKPWGPNNSINPSQPQEAKFSLVPSSKEIESWKDKPPECIWEAKALITSTNL